MRGGPSRNSRIYSSIFLRNTAICRFERSKNADLYCYVISYVTRLSVRLCVISRNTRQFKVYERLSRRYYADISSRSEEPCFHRAPRSTALLLVFKPVVVVSLSSAFFRILQRRNSMYVYVATCGATLRNESAKMLSRGVN